MKRATTAEHCKNPLNSISIHALVKRATLTDVIQEITWGISIHALVKRATKSDIGEIQKIFDFNPRPREEGDSKRKSQK